VTQGVDAAQGAQIAALQSANASAQASASALAARLGNMEQLTSGTSPLVVTVITLGAQMAAVLAANVSTQAALQQLSSLVNGVSSTTLSGSISTLQSQSVSTNSALSALNTSLSASIAALDLSSSSNFATQAAQISALQTGNRSIFTSTYPDPTPQLASLSSSVNVLNAQMSTISSWVSILNTTGSVQTVTASEHADHCSRLVHHQSLSVIDHDHPCGLVPDSGCCAYRFPAEY
jgi:HAMP domain-containing protein